MGNACSAYHSYADAQRSVHQLKHAWDEAGGIATHPRWLYPMFVVRVDVFLTMTEAAPHQHLKRNNALATYIHSPSSPTAAFVSHQWCGRVHPDPQFKQLRVLQQMFCNAIPGRLYVDVDFYSAGVYFHRPVVKARSMLSAQSWVLWYDYFSAPQPDAPDTDPAEQRLLKKHLEKAVQSLPFYVASCAMFFVLAPSVRHEDGHVVDYASWKGRGWCRLERISRIMSPEPSSSILQVLQADTIFELGAHEYLVEPVGLGAFSNNSDKHILCPVVESLLVRKLHALHSVREIRAYQQLLAWYPKLMEGLEADGAMMRSAQICHLQRQMSELGAVSSRATCSEPTHSASDVTVADFFQLLQLKGEAATLCRRPLPLLVASGLGDVRMMGALLQLRASVECCRRQSDVSFFYTAGQQPIHSAAQRGHTSAVEMLIEYRASVDAQDCLKQTPLFYAMAAGGCRMINLLLDRRAAISHKGLVVDSTPLYHAVMFSRPAAVQLLLERRASIAKSQDGSNLLHLAAAFRPGVEVMRLLIEARVGLEDRLKPRFGSNVMIILMFLSIPGYFGRRSRSALAARHFWGITPLGVAVMLGSSAEVDVLLEAGADVNARQASGMTVKDLANLFERDE